MIPSPGDLLLETAIWIGVPALVLAPVVLVLAIIEWRNAVRAAAKAAGYVRETVDSFWERTAWVKVIGLIVAESATVASAFSLLRFYVVLFASDSPLRGGPQFRWQELWTALTTYNDATGLPVTAAYGALGWLLALNVTLLIRSTLAVAIVKAVGYLVILVVGLTVVGWVLLFAMVWSLATWMNNPGYNLDMLAVYGAGGVLSTVLALGAAYSILLSRTALGGASAR